MSYRVEIQIESHEIKLPQYQTEPLDWERAISLVIDLYRLAYRSGVGIFPFPGTIPIRPISIDETPIGRVEVDSDVLRLHNGPSEETPVVAIAHAGDRHNVYETRFESHASGKVWYRLGRDLWARARWLVILPLNEKPQPSGTLVAKEFTLR